MKLRAEKKPKKKNKKSVRVEVEDKNAEQADEGEAAEETLPQESEDKLNGSSGDASPEDEAAALEPEEQTEPIREEPTEASLLAAAKDLAAENYNKYLRAMAELENFKKRTAKERSELLRYAGEQLAYELLEVLDTLELALAQEHKEVSGEWVKGIEMVEKQWKDVFQRFQIKAESAQGEQFDPEKHEAMSSIPSPEHQPGEVIEEFRKAYFFKDKLLRPAQVVVAMSQPEESKDEGDEAGTEEEVES